MGVRLIVLHLHEHDSWLRQRWRCQRPLYELCYFPGRVASCTDDSYANVFHGLICKLKPLKNVLVN